MKGVQAAVFGGSALILLILALRLTLKNHLPRRLLPALWCIAALRFLLPVEIPTRLSVWNLLRGTAETQAAPIASALLPFPQLSAAQAAPAAAAPPPGLRPGTRSRLPPSPCQPIHGGPPHARRVLYPWLQGQSIRN